MRLCPYAEQGSGKRRRIVDFNKINKLPPKMFIGFSDNTNLTFTESTKTVSITDLKSNASGTLEVKSKNVTLSVSLSYGAPAKTIKSINIPAGQTVKNAYVVGDTFNPANLTVNVKYTNALYEDMLVEYNDYPSRFSFTYKYEGSESTEDIPSSTAFSLPEGVDNCDARVKITYTDGNGSASVNTLVVHVTSNITPVSNLSIKNLDHKLDIYDHKTYQLEAEVTPAGATDKTVKWESLTPEIATVTEDGFLTVIADNTETSIQVRCTTNGKDASGNPIVKDKTISLYKHSSFSFVIGDENGNPITVAENFRYELGKTYTITATDINFPDEDEDISWTINSGANSINLLVNSGKQAKFYVKKAADTMIQLYANCHDSGNKGTPQYSSKYQDVSSVKEKLQQKNITYIPNVTNINQFELPIESHPI